MHTESDLITTTTAGSGDNIPNAANAEIDLEILRSIPKEFAIDCQEHANWLVRKIVEARAYAERVKEWAEQEQRRAAREEQQLVFLFGRQLESWAQLEIAKFSGRRKSLTLPAGTVGYRRINAKLIIDDENIVMAWARLHCQSAIMHVEKLVKSEIDRHTQSTGNIPDAGAHIEPAIERFFIR